MNPNRKWIALSYLLAFVLLYFLLSRFLGTVMVWVGLEEYDFHLLSEHFTVTSLMGLLLGAGTALYCYRHPALDQLSNEVVVELKKVTWPTLRETRGATVVVIITVFIMAAFLGVFDLFWSKAMDLLYPGTPV